MLLDLRKLIFKIYISTHKKINSITRRTRNYDYYFMFYFRILSTFKKEFYFNLGKTKIYYNPNSSGLGWSIYFNGNFEKEELEICKSLIKKDSVVFDIGANIGLHSVFFSQYASEGMVFSFEPANNTFNYLLKNASNFENIIVQKIALNDKNGLINFFEFENDVMSSIKNTHRSDIKKKTNVVCMKGDELINIIGINKFDFLKIDVEGLENEVINGFVNSIKKYKPIIFCEIVNNINSNNNSEGTINTIINFGYDCFVIENNNLTKFEKKLSANHFNYFFIPIKNEKNN